MQNLLALFPLNTVLFPGAVLPLVIFEPRYRQMINHCMQHQQPFGVVLIREGVEVGGSAEPYEIGTTAVIQNALKFPDGRMLLSTQGEQRFRITEIVQREPYLVAQIEHLHDATTPDAAAVAEHIAELYAQHRVALTHATGVQQQMNELPTDPIELSYRLCDQFRVVNYSKQQLLEADLDERLAAISDALDRELRFLPQPPSTPPQGNEGPWSLN